MKRGHILFALGVGISVGVFPFAAGTRVPADVSDFLGFPGMAAGSVLFGHSVAMVATALAANVAFYSLLTLGVLRLFVRRRSGQRPPQN